MLYKYNIQYTPFYYGDRKGDAHGDVSNFSLNFAKEKKNG